MKFATFNVNGIRAILGKGFADAFRAIDADLFALNETKWSDDSPGSFPFQPEGYETYFTNSKARKGYSGVAVFARNRPLSVHYGLLDGKYDEEGRVITLEYPAFYFVAAYVPNAGDGLKRLSFRMQYELDLLDYLNALKSKKEVIYCEDLNVAHEPIDLKNPKQNEGNPGYTKEERDSFSRLLQNGYHDVWRERNPDRAQYSWWSYRFHAREKNVGWRIDYFVLTEGLVPLVRDIRILDEVMGSDHCPVVMEADIDA